MRSFSCIWIDPSNFQIKIQKKSALGAKCYRNVTRSAPGVKIIVFCKVLRRRAKSNVFLLILYVHVLIFVRMVTALLLWMAVSVCAWCAHARREIAERWRGEAFFIGRDPGSVQGLLGSFHAFESVRAIGEKVS